jgi:hypothetical protein
MTCHCTATKQAVTIGDDIVSGTESDRGIVGVFGQRDIGTIDVQGAV